MPTPPRRPEFWRPERSRTGRNELDALSRATTRAMRSCVHSPRGGASASDLPHRRARIGAPSRPAGPPLASAGRTILGASGQPVMHTEARVCPHVVCLYISEGGRRAHLMADIDIDELGPIDYLVVEFPPGRSHFTGEMAAEIGRLVDAKLVRVLDLLILQKAEDGTIEAFEIDDLDAVDDLRAAEGQLAELLAEEDVEHLAAAMEPGTTAGVLVWENAWAAPFASAARRAGGQLIASGRIPIQAILASLEADEPIEGD